MIKIYRKTCMNLLIYVFLFVIGKGTARADEVTRVFLFAGQSNMVGSDANPKQIDEFPSFKGAAKPQNDVLFSCHTGNGPGETKGWGPLKPRDSFGPELTFARQVKTRVNGPIAIIKFAVGGTTVAFDWNPDAPDQGQKLYPKFLKFVRESLKDLEKRGIKYRLEGVMWHQGENDMLDRNLYKKYSIGLSSLIRRLREDLNAPQLKWYIAEISEKGIWGMDHRHNLGVLHQQQALVLQSDPLLCWVPTSHLAFAVMGNGQPHYHFGTQGQLQLGEAFAAAYLRDVGQSVDQTGKSSKNGFPAGEKSKVRLFVLAGQRNMEGEDAFLSEIPKVAGFETIKQSQERVLFRYSLGGGVKASSGWEPLGPVGLLGNFGPELSFGNILRHSIDAKTAIGILKFTHSGAQGPDWSPKDSPESHRSLYPKLLAFISQAREDLKKRGLDSSLEGVFWHTGENDTFYSPYAQNNAKWMKNLIEQMRLDLQQPYLHWYISGQHKDSPWRNIELVNQGLKDLAETLPNITIIPTSDLPHEKVHFGTRGTILLGKKMAETYLQNNK